MRHLELFRSNPGGWAWCTCVCWNSFRGVEMWFLSKLLPPSCLGQTWIFAIKATLKNVPRQPVLNLSSDWGRCVRKQVAKGNSPILPETCGRARMARPHYWRWFQIRLSGPKQCLRLSWQNSWSLSLNAMINLRIANRSLSRYKACL